MERRTAPETAHDNAAGFWLAQARALGLESRRTACWTAVRCRGDGPDSHRVVVTRPYGDASALARELAGLHREWGTEPLCVEDPYGDLDLAPHGFEAALPQAVMVREPDGAVGGASAAVSAGAEAGSGSGSGSRFGAGAGTGAVVSAPGSLVADAWAVAGASVGDGPGRGLRAGTGARPGVDVREALDDEGLAAVERVVVEGFPLPARLPLRQGALLPPALLGAPGWRGWTARREGETAGACVSYDDGTVVGLYWVATLPQHRSHGVGRALLEAVLAAHPGRPATLTATLLGEPLYRRLGFRERALSRWWRSQAAPAGSGR